MKRNLFVVAASAVLVVHAGGAVLTLSPVADTTISENDAARATFDGTTIIVGRLSGNGGESRCRSLLRFDPGALPADATITSVTLTVTVLRNHAGDADPHGLHRVNQAWTEEHASWLTSGLEDWVGGDAEFGADSTANLGAGAGMFHSTPAMIAAVRSWRAAPLDNHGWLLVSSDEESSGNARRIASRESPGSGPVLTIHYTVPDRFPGPPPGELGDIRLTNAALRFQFTLLPGTNYLVQRREAFDGASWVPVTNFTAAGTASVATVIHTVTAGSHFFRVLLTPALP